MKPLYLRLLAILLPALLIPACARLKASDELPFKLTLELNKQQYQPGEAVICAVNLLNDTATTRSVLIPNYSLTRFTVASLKDPNDPHFIEPVFSTKEPLGGQLELGPHDTMPPARRFVFPQLTYERGEFVLQATHEQQGTGVPMLASRQVTQSVAVKNGEETVVGGLTRERFLQRSDKAPGIGSIPILGFLLGNETTSKKKSVIAVAICATRVGEDVTDAEVQSGVGVRENVTDGDKALMEQAANEQVVVMLPLRPYIGLESTELNVALDVSDVTGYTPQGTPIIEHRFLATTMQIKHGQPIVLGGIKRKEKVQTSGGIPYLREIPVLGYLFSREVTTQRDKEIVVILTPRFNLCTSADLADAPEQVKTAVAMTQEDDVRAVEAQLNVPSNPFGFDQWLLDKDLR